MLHIMPSRTDLGVALCITLPEWLDDAPPGCVFWTTGTHREGMNDVAHHSTQKRSS